MAYSSDTIAGFWPVERDATFADTTSGSVPGVSLGQSVRMFDPYWGSGEFVFVKFDTASTAVAFGSIVTWDTAFLVAKTAAAASVVSGGIVGVLASRFASNAAVTAANPLFGWAQVIGTVPATFAVAATAGAVFAGTAGNATPTAAAGKQILGAQTIVAATGTVTKVCNTTNGQTLASCAKQARALSWRCGFWNRHCCFYYRYA